jgi:hypothetical protein
MRVAWVVVLTIASGAIAWGVFSDAREARQAEILSRIEAAELEIPFAGTRRMGGARNGTFKVWSRDGVKRVEFSGAAKEPKTSPWIPDILRPGHEQGKRRIKDLGLAARNYEIAITGRDVVAGRACDVVEIRPRYAGRPGYRMTADLENRFPLSFEVLSKGEKLFESRFDEIEYQPLFPEGRFSEARHAGRLNVTRENMAPDRLATAAGFPVWRPAWLPPGFELRGSEILRFRGELLLMKMDTPVVHFNYTDGLALLSVVEISATSEMWQYFRKWVAGPSRIGEDGKLVARKFSDRGGSAWLLELEGTVTLVAGTISSEEIKKTIRTFERR